MGEDGLSSTVSTSETSNVGRGPRGVGLTEAAGGWGWGSMGGQVTPGSLATLLLGCTHSEQDPPGRSLRPCGVTEEELHALAWVVWGSRVAKAP